MATSQRLNGKTWKDQTSLREASRAKTSATQDNAKASLLEHEARYGKNTTKAFAHYDQRSHSLRTSQHSLSGDSTWSLQTLPAQGTMRNGLLYRQATLAHHTLENDYSLLPTPDGSGQTGSNARKALAKRGGIMNWPTPTVDCQEGGEQSSRIERTSNGGFLLRKKNKPESTFGAKLSDAVLFVAKTQLPTPNARDWKGKSQKEDDLNSSVARLENASGKLNPLWVAWLMGFPTDWLELNGETKSKLWETQSSPNAPSSLRRGLRK